MQRFNNKRPIALLGLAVLLSLALPAVAQDDVDPLEATRVAFMGAETDEERLAIAEDFLAKYPEHDNIGDVLDAAIGVLQGMDNEAGAIKLAEEQLLRTEGADQTRAIQTALLDLYADPAHAGKLKGLVQDMYDPATMTFGDHLTVLNAATGAEAWSMVDTHAEAAKPMATAEAFKAAYPDRDFTDKYVEEMGSNRQGLLLTFAGWSAANQGDLKGAEKTFKQAEKLVRPNFFGLPNNELYRYWGETLVLKDDSKKGLEKLALAGLYSNDDVAAARAEDVYASLDRKEDYDDYLWDLRRKKAPKMEDFEAVNYQDEMKSFHELKGKKATLVSFWFPT